MQTSNFELWVLNGPHWRLPINVRWWDACAEVNLGAGISLLEIQKVAGQKRLEQIRYRSVNETGHYFVMKYILEKNAHRAVTTDPEELVEWTPRRIQKMDGEPLKNEFIDGYCQSPYAVLRDPLMADYTYASFCKWILHWLLVERKTVDIGFAELDAFQVRENWAQVLAKMEMEKCQSKTRYIARLESMISRGVAKFAISDFILGWKGEGCDWTLAARTNEDWDKTVDAIEAERRKMGMPYPFAVLDQLKRQLPRLLVTYAQYLKRSALPALKLLKSRSAGSAPRPGAEQVCRKPIPPCSPFLDRGTLAPVEEASARPLENLESENAELPALPDLQPETSDLRDCVPAVG